MKRYVYLVLLIVVSVLVAAPMGLALTGHGAVVQPNMAQAAPAPTFVCAKDSNGKCSQLLLDTAPCVPLGLPIFKNSGKCDGGAGVSNTGQGGAIIAYLTLALKLLSGIVGAVIMLMLVVAGVQYITSAGDPAMVKSAKNRIVNAITALVLYLMMFAVLNFLVPGGIL